MIFRKYLVLVRVGPRFLKPFRSWSDLVLDFSIFFGPGPGPIGFGPWIPALKERSKGHFVPDHPKHVRHESRDHFFKTEKKYSNVTSDPSVKDVDFFLDVLEMFQTWLAATREQLAEQKVQNEAHINEITNMLSMNNLL